MINVHIYPSTFEHESRILRMTQTLTRHGIVDRILIIAQGAPGLRSEEQIDEWRSVWRIKSAIKHRKFLRRATRFLGWSLSVFWKLRRQSVGMVNCHSLSVLPLCIALKLWHRSILIYEPHELETETSTYTGFRKKLAQWAEAFFFRWVDHSIFVGQRIKDWYIRKYGLHRADVVYNSPLFHPQKNTDVLRKTFSIPTHMPIFIYQGILSEGRGIRPLVEAFSGFADHATLVVLGKGPLEEWVKTEATKNHNIFHHPTVPPKNLMEYTSSADYGVSFTEPSSLNHEYCMPNKLFEYILANKPILVTPAIEQKEFVEQYQIGEVIRDFSPQEIRSAALRLIQRDHDMLMSALSKVQELYSWQSQEIRLINIYQTVLGNREEPSLQKVFKDYAKGDKYERKSYAKY